MTTIRIDSMNLGEAALSTLRDAYLYDDATLAAATPGDIAGLPAGLRIRLRTEFTNLASTLTHAVHTHPAAKPNPLLDSIDDRPAAISAIVGRIAAGEKSPDLRRAARRLGIEGVARMDGKVSIEATISYLAHLDDGGSRRAMWKDHEIVGLDELSSKLRRSPTSGRELEDGVDPRTGIDWTAQSDEVIAQIAYASGDDMIAGMGDTQVVVAFTGGDSELVKRVQRRMKAARIDPEEILRGLRSGPTTPTTALRAEPMRDEPARTPIKLGGNLTGNLNNLLMAMYDAEGVRRLCRHLPDGSRLESNLPGGSSSMSQVAWAAADNMVRWGLVNRDLRDKMVLDRPRRQAEIDAVFGAAGIL